LNLNKRQKLKKSLAIDWQKKVREGGVLARRRTQIRLYSLARRQYSVKESETLPLPIQRKYTLKSHSEPIRGGRVTRRPNTTQYHSSVAA